MRKMRVRLTHPNNVTLYPEKGASSTVSLLIYNSCGGNFHFDFSPLQRGFSPAFVRGEASRFLLFLCSHTAFLAWTRGDGAKNGSPAYYLSYRLSHLRSLLFWRMMVSFLRSDIGRVGLGASSVHGRGVVMKRRRGGSVAVPRPHPTALDVKRLFADQNFRAAPGGRVRLILREVFFLCLRRRKRPGRTDIGPWR